MKTNVVPQKYCGKYISPPQMLGLLKRNEHNRIWILKQLSQLGISIDILQDCPLHELYKHCDQIIKSTYSIKYLGMNQNEMGIISRRIDPFKDHNFNLSDLPQCPYKVNKFFYPKPLKVGRKTPKQNLLNSDNLEQEIKNAFIKKTPLKGCVKDKKKLAGSWMNTTVKSNKTNHFPTVQSQPNKNIKQGKITKKQKRKEIIIELPDSISEWKNNTSYSGFLKSGLLFSNQQKNEQYLQTKNH